MTTEEEEEYEYLLTEFLNGHEDLDRESANRLLQHANLVARKVSFLSGPVWVVDTGDNKYILEEDDDVFTSQDIVSWLDSAVNDPHKYVAVDDLEDFWDGKPPILYHATDADNVDDILKCGLIPSNETRALTNRFVGPAVFTSLNPDAIKIYGDTILEIDTASMRNDGVIPPVSIEEGIGDYEAMSAIVYAVGAEDYYTVELDSSEGLDYDTVVVFGEIPPKYIRVY